MNASRLLQKLEDFRLLPVFVIVAMAVGIAIGKALSISDFELTPPIDAIKSIAGGTFDPSVAGLLSLGVPIGPLPDDVPGHDERAPRRGRPGLPLAAPARASCSFSTTSSHRSSCSCWRTSSSVDPELPHGPRALRPRALHRDGHRLHLSRQGQRAHGPRLRGHQLGGPDVAHPRLRPSPHRQRRLRRPRGRARASSSISGSRSSPGCSPAWPSCDAVARPPWTA